MTSTTAGDDEQHRLGDQTGAASVVLCRLRYRLERFAPRDTGPAPAAAPPITTPPVTAPPPGS